MYKANQYLFASNEQTSELIRSGRYRDQIDRFQPFLREWRQTIDSTERECLPKFCFLFMGILIISSAPGDEAYLDD